MIISVFGDSIVWGAYDLELGGWVNRLKLYYDNKGGFEVDIYNHGISGDRISDVLNRFETEAKAVMPDKIILAIGINDSPHWANLFGTKLSDFENRFNELLEKSKKFTKDILIVGLTNVDDSNKLHGYKNEKIEKYDQKLKEIAQQQNLPFIDLFGSLGKKDLLDGLHPSASGHKKIFEKVKEII